VLWVQRRYWEHITCTGPATGERRRPSRDTEHAHRWALPSAARTGGCAAYSGHDSSGLLSLGSGGKNYGSKAKHLTMMAYWLAAILLVTYSIALILVGHGAAPLALLLVWGDPADMLPGQVLSWASIVGLVFVTIWFRHDPQKLDIWQLTASTILYLSWFVFAYFGAGPSLLWNSLRVSAPFQVAFVLVAGILIGQIARRHRERRAASRSSSNP